VLVITHNREFSESICSEVWAMNQGYLEASGHNWVEGQGAGPRIDKVDDEEKEVFDAMGWVFLSACSNFALGALSRRSVELGADSFFICCTPTETRSSRQRRPRPSLLPSFARPRRLAW